MSRFVIHTPGNQPLPPILLRELERHHIVAYEAPEPEVVSPELEQLIQERGGDPHSGITLEESRKRLDALFAKYA